MINPILVIGIGLFGFGMYRWGFFKGRKEEKFRVERLIRQALNIRMSGTVRWIYNAVMDDREDLMPEDEFFGVNDKLN